MKALLSACFLLLCLQIPADFQSFDAVVMLDHPENRADRFYVRLGDRNTFLKLCFVAAAPATGQPSDSPALQREAAYFGLPGRAAALRSGEEALAFMRKTLRVPFRVQTLMTAVPGDDQASVYGFVTPASGGDAAALLVRAGLARSCTEGDRNPLGVAHLEIVTLFQDLQDAAMLERAGAWALSDPILLPRARAQQRRSELKTHPPLNVNTANEDELQRLPGMDAALAGRIIRGRPYHSTQDLLDVRGIGEKVLDTWQGRIVIQ